MLMSYLRNKTIARPIAVLLMAALALGVYMTFALSEQEAKAAGGVSASMDTDGKGKIEAKVEWGEIASAASWLWGLTPWGGDSNNNSSSSSSACTCGCTGGSSGSSSSSCGC